MGTALSEVLQTLTAETYQIEPTSPHSDTTLDELIWASTDEAAADPSSALMREDLCEAQGCDLREERLLLARALSRALSEEAVAHAGSQASATPPLGSDTPITPGMGGFGSGGQSHAISDSGLAAGLGSAACATPSLPRQHSFSTSSGPLSIHTLSAHSLDGLASPAAFEDFLQEPPPTRHSAEPSSGKACMHRPASAPAMSSRPSDGYAVIRRIFTLPGGRSAVGAGSAAGAWVADVTLPDGEGSASAEGGASAEIAAEASVEADGASPRSRQPLRGRPLVSHSHGLGSPPSAPGPSSHSLLPGDGLPPVGGHPTSRPPSRGSLNAPNSMPLFTTRPVKKHQRTEGAVIASPLPQMVGLATVYVAGGAAVVPVPSTSPASMAPIQQSGGPSTDVSRTQQPPLLSPPQMPPPRWQPDSLASHSDPVPPHPVPLSSAPCAVASTTVPSSSVGPQSSSRWPSPFAEASAQPPPQLQLQASASTPPPPPRLTSGPTALGDLPSPKPRRVGSCILPGVHCTASTLPGATGAPTPTDLVLPPSAVAPAAAETIAAVTSAASDLGTLSWRTADSETCELPRPVALRPLAGHDEDGDGRHGDDGVGESRGDGAAGSEAGGGVDGDEGCGDTNDSSASCADAGVASASRPVAHDAQCVTRGANGAGSGSMANGGDAVILRSAEGRAYRPQQRAQHQLLRFPLKAACSSARASAPHAPPAAKPPSHAPPRPSSKVPAPRQAAKPPAPTKLPSQADAKSDLKADSRPEPKARSKEGMQACVQMQGAQAFGSSPDVLPSADAAPQAAPSGTLPLTGATLIDSHATSSALSSSVATALADKPHKDTAASADDFVAVDLAEAAAEMRRILSAKARQRFEAEAESDFEWCEAHPREAEGHASGPEIRHRIPRTPPPSSAPPGASPFRPCGVEQGARSTRRTPQSPTSPPLPSSSAFVRSPLTAAFVEPVAPVAHRPCTGSSLPRAAQDAPGQARPQHRQPKLAVAARAATFVPVATELASDCGQTTASPMLGIAAPPSETAPATTHAASETPPSPSPGTLPRASLPSPPQPPAQSAVLPPAIIPSATRPSAAPIGSRPHGHAAHMGPMAPALRASHGPHGPSLHTSSGARGAARMPPVVVVDLMDQTVARMPHFSETPKPPTQSTEPTLALPAANASAALSSPAESESATAHLAAVTAAAHRTPAPRPNSRAEPIPTIPVDLALPMEAPGLAPSAAARAFTAADPSPSPPSPPSPRSPLYAPSPPTVPEEHLPVLPGNAGRHWLPTRAPAVPEDTLGRRPAVSIQSLRGRLRRIEAALEGIPAHHGRLFDQSASSEVNPAGAVD